MNPEEFRIVCPCGTPAAGRRSSRPQTLRCKRCSGPLLVMPRSPLPAALLPPGVGGGSGRPWPFWAAPAAAAAVTLTLVAVAFVVVLPRFVVFGGSPRSLAPVPSGRPAWQRHEDAARQALTAGSARKAAAEFALAVEHAIDPGERRRLERLHRQTALVADCLADSLADVVRVAAGTPADEWQLIFDDRYRGRSVLFDSRVRVGPGGEPEVDFEIAPAPARLDLSGLRCLHGLPLGAGRRVLFGGRVESVRRDGVGWVVQLASDSGVLLTDPDVLAATSLPPEPALDQLLRDQAAWIDRPDPAE